MDKLEKYINLNFLCISMPQIKNLFVGACHGMPLQKIYDADADTLKNAYGFNKSVINKFNSIKKYNPAKAEIQNCKKLNIKIVTLEDDHYPAPLKQIFDPPICLYYIGELPQKDDFLLAVVGSRNATELGKLNAENISFELASCGAVIVSGMARGVDTRAHTGALNANGKTIAVLGCGLDITYPPENKALMKRISEHGAVISEFGLGAEPNPWHFPLRNRIISGLSRGVIVVEASQKSGSLITAGCALEQGRDVFAMPGNTLSSVAKGANKLIKDGAKLIENAEDVLSEYNINITAIKKEKSIPALNDTEKKIYALLAEPADIEELAVKTNLPINILSSALSLMEHKGIVKKLPRNVYVKK